MYSLVWGEGDDAWGRRRRLLAWEEDLTRECRSLLSNVTLQDFVTMLDNGALMFVMVILRIVCINFS